MIDVSVIRHYVAYSRWATLRLLDATRELSDDELTRDFGTADKSIAGTLAHICAAERIWLSRIQDSSSISTLRTPGDSDFKYILEVWPEVMDGWRRWAESLQEGYVEEFLHYTDLRGREWRQPLWQIVFQVVNHSTHHRGQVSGFLRAMSRTPPALDFIVFVRQQVS